MSYPLSPPQGTKKVPAQRVPSNKYPMEIIKLLILSLLQFGGASKSDTKLLLNEASRYIKDVQVGRF